MARLVVAAIYLWGFAAVILAIAAWRPRRPDFVWPAVLWPVTFLLIFRFSVVARLAGGTSMDYESEWVLMPALFFCLPATFISGAIGMALMPWRHRIGAVLLLGAGALTIVTA